MFRPLTAEGRFESGLDDLLASKPHAYLAVIGVHHPAALAVAVADEPGHYPVPEAWAHADDMLTMQKHADELNASLGLNLRAAAEIVCSSFRAGRVDQDKGRGFRGGP